MKLECYLNGESLADQESRRQYAAELQLFAELIDLYDDLARTVNAGSRKEMPAHLFLVVRRQFYGVEVFFQGIHLVAVKRQTSDVSVAV